MAGSESGVNQSIGGASVKLSPNEPALSPPDPGFHRMGIDGVGWGTAVTRDKVWTTSFQREDSRDGFSMVVPLVESDFSFNRKNSLLMGIGVAANG